LSDLFKTKKVLRADAFRAGKTLAEACEGKSLRRS